LSKWQILLSLALYFMLLLASLMQGKCADLIDEMSSTLNFEASYTTGIRTLRVTSTCTGICSRTLAVSYALPIPIEH